MAPAPEGAPNQEGHAVVMVLFYVALFAIFYFLLIRPQTKRNREVKSLQESLKKGDSVLTSGGMFGVIYKIKDDVVTVEIAENVRVKMQKSAILERLKDNEGAGKPDNE
ncbi:MAG: preprotein translocase subunit YajC [Nitrospinae bacterium]|nr:preprotein translocase subunit YajC [Nitrospinota bacterium]